MTPLQKTRATPVEGIPAVDGWTLHRSPEYGRPDRQDYWEYYATKGKLLTWLRVSTTHFTPTAERFSWLVRHSFPAGRRNERGTLIPLSNDWIDSQLAADGARCTLCQYPSGCAPEPCAAFPGRT